MQEILVDAFQLMRGFVFYQKKCAHMGSVTGAASTVEESIKQTKFNVQNMSGSSQVIREMEVNGLGRFTAFANHAIKVHFDDRTIVRMQKG